MMTHIGYFPGCSLVGSGIEFDLSIRALSKLAGVTLVEVDDWNCCGACAAHNLNYDLAMALPYRSLALAEQQGLEEVLAPCAACFNRLKGTAIRLARNKALGEKMETITERPYTGKVRIVSITEYINRLVDDNLKDKLVHPLSGMKVAAYYGCLLNRGEDIVKNDNVERPAAMEPPLRAAGTEPVAWNYSTECCGCGFSMSMTGAVVDLCQDILVDAKASGAEVVVTGCPMCHSNLDMRQKKMKDAGLGAGGMPVVYISELVALAAGLAPRAVGLDRHFIDAMGIAERSR